ncbi:NUDIX hydrolase [Pedobacter yulinensis]|uniref:NUDIX hydrolase n=1 Tax=Pedobacter yulinensis TaxID=2126353 RepID=A0A2T3HN48_9SPHI|nr:NUDIX domain-containing protein [Pedobacter yulinensis]PST83837.1 NUDIX hydrolase [Pedobacter yulinensis]
MAKLSAGLLVYRNTPRGPEFLLAHPGGPLFVRRDEGWWSVPKGEPEPGEALLQAALREFSEETGLTPSGPYLELQPITQKGGKQVHCWACEGAFDGGQVKANTFRMEWPPRSGKFGEFAEVDRIEWFDAGTARVKINAAQADLITELERLLQARSRATHQNNLL